MNDINKNNSNSSLQKFSNFVIFQTENGKVNIDVFFRNETLWLTQKLISELFEKGRSTITEHLHKIFSDGELDEKQVCRNFRHTTKHGAVKGKKKGEKNVSVAKHYLQLDCSNKNNDENRGNDEKNEVRSKKN